MYFRCGAMAFIPDNEKPDIDRESDAKTYSGGETVSLDVNVKRGMWLMILTPRLAYIYSIIPT
jgi:hypothetical protein